MTVNEWLAQGAKEFVVVKINRGRKNTHYVLLGRLVGIEDEDYGLIQVGHVYSSPEMPRYTWMTPAEVAVSYGRKLCKPAEEMLLQ